jgi:hypothetical protein
MVHCFDCSCLLNLQMQNHTTWAFAPACVTYKKINVERDTYGNPCKL